jgi:hypothetical protein
MPTSRRAIATVSVISDFAISVVVITYKTLVHILTDLEKDRPTMNNVVFLNDEGTSLMRVL